MVLCVGCLGGKGCSFHMVLCVGGLFGWEGLFVFPYGALCGLFGWEGLFVFPYGALCGLFGWDCALNVYSIFRLIRII